MYPLSMGLFQGRYWPRRTFRTSFALPRRRICCWWRMKWVSLLCALGTVFFSEVVVQACDYKGVLWKVQMFVITKACCDYSGLWLQRLVVITKACDFRGLVWLQRLVVITVASCDYSVLWLQRPVVVRKACDYKGLALKNKSTVLRFAWHNNSFWAVEHYELGSDVSETETDRKCQPW